MCLKLSVFILHEVSINQLFWAKCKKITLIPISCNNSNMIETKISSVVSQATLKGNKLRGCPKAKQYFKCALFGVRQYRNVTPLHYCNHFCRNAVINFITDIISVILYPLKSQECELTCVEEFSNPSRHSSTREKKKKTLTSKRAFLVAGIWWSRRRHLCDRHALIIFSLSGKATSTKFTRLRCFVCFCDSDGDCCSLYCASTAPIILNCY